MASKEWAALFDALDADTDALAAAIAAEFQRQLPSYAAVPLPELTAGIHVQVQRVLGAARWLTAQGA